MIRLWALYWAIVGVATVKWWINQQREFIDSVLLDRLHYWATGQYFRIWAELGRPNLLGKFG